MILLIPQSLDLKTETNRFLDELKITMSSTPKIFTSKLLLPSYILLKNTKNSYSLTRNLFIHLDLNLISNKLKLKVYLLLPNKKIIARKNRSITLQHLDFSNIEILINDVKTQPIPIHTLVNKLLS